MEAYSRNGRQPRSYVNTALVLCNVIVFVVLEIMGSTQNARFMVDHGAAYTPFILEGGKEYLRFLYSIFLHFGPEHLISNMVGLFFIGDNLERAMGHLRYLVFYLLCGVGASVCSMAAHALVEPYAVAAGASGAICGVVGGLLWVVMANRGRLEEMTTARVGFLIFYLIYSGLRSTGVDNIAHISGAVLGFILARILYDPSAGLIVGQAYVSGTGRKNLPQVLTGLLAYVIFLCIIVKITQFFIVI